MCKGTACTNAAYDFTADDDGQLSATIPAWQRFWSTTEDKWIYCRLDECHLDVRWGSQTVASLPYELASGTLTATPGTGLSDGDTVQISGTGMMRTYDGPSIWIFPTGRWSLTQCDAAVLDDLSVIGTFTHCSVAPPTRGVTIEGSTLDTSLQVESEIDKILGGTTDCAASSGACVVGLLRLEADGSISEHLTPITFTS